MGEDATTRRKDAHLDLVTSQEVEPSAPRTLLDCVHLVHCAMPELSLDEVDTSAELFGKRLSLPLVITAMTGGTERAGAVNRELASLAERHAVAFGVGSQRAMAEAGERAASFRVRDVAPSAVVIGNIGVRQAAELGVDGVRRLSEAIGADGMALHLNPAQELIQPEGDRDFRGGYQLTAALAKAYGDRLLVKETGCGLSPEVARRLVDCGVRALDVSGLGGTSFLRVEQLRASGAAAEVGVQLAGWGIPTAASVASVRRAVGPGVKLIASGGIRTGLEAAKAVALGADLAGMALPLLRALNAGGSEAAAQALEVFSSVLRRALLLTGSRSLAELRKRPVVLTGELKAWLAAL
ncbi:MAG: type 2 isopentenyl-diphosphate Delta-isomerase [Myxococcales bacterium]|nr:type 2 isopentenyl-diphosphate Delta-isomerase [Myxococcales bacterium]